MRRTLLTSLAMLVATAASAQSALPLTVTKWYPERCPSEPAPTQASPPAIAAIVLPKLIDAAVDHAAAAIKAAADT